MVHDYVEYMKWFHGSLGWKFLNSVGPFLVVPTLVVGLVLWARRGDVWHSVWDAVLMVVYVVSIRLGRSRLQRLRRTAEMNGWDDPG